VQTVRCLDNPFAIRGRYLETGRHRPAYSHCNRGNRAGRRRG